MYQVAFKPHAPRRHAPRLLPFEAWPLEVRLLNFKFGVHGGDAHLRGLGLGVYRDAPNNACLLGLLDASMHDHDRWFYAFYEAESYQRGWFAILPEHETDSRTGDSLRPTNENEIVDQLVELSYLVEPHEDELSQASLMRLVYSQMLGTKEAVLFDLKPTLAPRELHELLHHTDSWQQHHPELNGLPWELVLRMHGLAPLLAVNSPQVDRLLQRSLVG